MNNAKEKAKQLVDKMDGFTLEDCVRNALTCVDEIIASSPSLPILGDGGYFGEDIELSTKWWKEVREEILSF